MGRYEEEKVPIVGEMSGGAQVITPNSLTHALMIIEAIIAAEQGVKNISPVIHGQGNLIQDVAACIALRELCREYLNRFGYNDVELSVVFTTWSGKFPADTAEAFAVICLSVIPPLLGGAQVAHVKTINEAHTIPRKEDNAASLRADKKVIEMLRGQRFELESKRVEEEIKTQKLETKAILDRVIDLGEGDVAVGAIKAFKLGVLDQVFPTNRYVAGKVSGIRDSEGAVRYFDHGNLPFTNEILEFHREKIADREKLQGRKVDYDLMIDDIFSISKGSLVTRFNT
jgi:methylaspartate mutase epsilon subunit